ncbi:MAG: rhodanese-like domain-containing protein [Actinomycetota bacterium]|nr:rhodanese-like domain-containing protein [Actinomycetota bacterium]
MSNFITAEELLAAARSEIARLTPLEALSEMRAGAVLIDIRTTEQRDRDGFLPGAYEISRNVLEWRLDPYGEYRDPMIACLDRRVIVICDEGYQSSLAAANLRRFGLDAADVIGGVQAWRCEGLGLRQNRSKDPVDPTPSEQLGRGREAPASLHIRRIDEEFGLAPTP